jgi:hypothetical protein
LLKALDFGCLRIRNPSKICSISFEELGKKVDSAVITRLMSGSSQNGQFE